MVFFHLGSYLIWMGCSLFGFFFSLCCLVIFFNWILLYQKKKKKTPGPIFLTQIALSNGLVSGWTNPGPQLYARKGLRGLISNQHMKQNKTAWSNQVHKKPIWSGKPAQLKSQVWSSPIGYVYIYTSMDLDPKLQSGPIMNQNPGLLSDSWNPQLPDLH